MDYFEEIREAEFIREENPKLVLRKTEVQHYYTGKTVLVTGGTGFLGTLFIEKLLRCCSDIKKLIIIFRSKKGNSMQQRATEHFSSPVYDKIKLSNLNKWHEKIEIVKGNCEKPYYDMEPSDWCRLQTEVNVIFHVAATIRFDEHIKISYNTNVSGTKNLLKLAEKAPNLSAFVYVSTAYSQSHLSYIEEKFYPTPFTDEQISQLIDALDYNELACMTPLILDGRFNTYTMTKAMAENVTKSYVGKLPVAIFRPSIVTSTFEEPLRGWTSSIAGATGIFLGAGAGFLRTLLCDPKCKAEIIPADRVINALLIIPLHLQKKNVNANIPSEIPTDVVHSSTANANAKRQTAEEEFIPIYNYTAQGETMNWNEVMQKFTWIGKVRKFNKNVMMWCHHLKLEKNYTLWVLEYYLLHILTLPVFILMEKAAKLPARVTKGYERLYYYTNQYSYFMLNSWNFAWQNCNDLISFTSEDDKILFNADNKIDWEPYFTDMVKGVPSYMLKLNWNTFEEPREKLKSTCIIIIDRLVVWTFRALCLWMMFKMFLSLIHRIFD